MYIFLFLPFFAIVLFRVRCFFSRCVCVCVSVSLVLLIRLSLSVHQQSVHNFMPRTLTFHSNIDRKQSYTKKCLQIERRKTLHFHMQMWCVYRLPKNRLDQTNVFTSPIFFRFLFPVGHFNLSKHNSVCALFFSLLKSKIRGNFLWCINERPKKRGWFKRIQLAINSKSSLHHPHNWLKLSAVVWTNWNGFFSHSRSDTIIIDCQIYVANKK